MESVGTGRMVWTGVVRLWRGVGGSLMRRTGWKCVGRSALSFVERCEWEYVNRGMGGCGEEWVGVREQGCGVVMERCGWAFFHSTD